MTFEAHLEAVHCAEVETSQLKAAFLKTAQQVCLTTEVGHLSIPGVGGGPGNIGRSQGIGG